MAVLSVVAVCGHSETFHAFKVWGFHNGFISLWNVRLCYWVSRSWVSKVLPFFRMWGAYGPVTPRYFWKILVLIFLSVFICLLTPAVLCCHDRCSDFQLTCLRCTSIISSFGRPLSCFVCHVEENLYTGASTSGSTTLAYVAWVVEVATRSIPKPFL